MAFTRCRNCRHYNDAHIEMGDARVCIARITEQGSLCPCRCFDPAGNSPEGIDIYRSDGPLDRGYHLADIPKGELGEISKISEEFLEFQDAVTQGAVIMQLCELSDMIGAIEAWLVKYHPSVKLADLIKMSELTKRAFRSGRRK